jgi:2'-5' RNA ligase
MARDRSTRPEAKPLRLFVAVDVPESIKGSLARGVAPFRDRIPGARWTRSEGWHLTLKFLGSTWPRLADPVKAAVAEAARGAVPFETALTEIGAFPSAGRARVVWAGLSDPDERLRELARSLDRGLREHFAPEKRAFSSHLTIARLNPPADLRSLIPPLIGTSVSSRPFLVEGLTLYRSHLSPRGATYEVLERFPLASR